MGPAWSRRAFIGALPFFASAQIPREAKKLLDPATEFELLRLTDPTESNSYLPPQPLRSIRNDSLLYISDRTGNLQAYTMDLKTGVSRSVTEAENLDRKTVCLSPDGKSVLYFDGSALRYSGARSRAIYTIQNGWTRTGCFSLSEDGNHAFIGETDGNRHRIQMVALRRNVVSTIVESTEAIHSIRPRPRRAGILYIRNRDLYLVNYDGQQNRRLRIAEGDLRQALWSAEGKTVLYLSAPSEPRRLPEMRECTPDTNEDKLIARTSMFITFARNGDSSVFAGVSANKGSPHILLLVRTGRREFTVAEHRASEPANVVVAFSPNSQQLYYHTDREGKSAIYTIGLERLVEQTETSAAYSPQVAANDLSRLRRQVI